MTKISNLHIFNIHGFNLHGSLLVLCGFVFSLMTQVTEPKLVFADYIDPSEIQVKTEKYTPETTDFRKGQYEYQVSWQGIPVASATVDIKNKEVESEKAYFVEAHAKTSKVIGVFYKLRHTSESLFYESTLKPIRFSSIQTENSRRRSSEIEFGENGEIRSALGKNGKKEDERKFVSENQTLDPISAAFLARSIPIEVGKKASFDVYNAKNRYLISFEVVGIEDISLPGQAEKRRAYKVIPTLNKLTDTEGEKRFNRAEIWIAADETRDILKMETEVFVGSVSAYLKKFSPEGGNPSSDSNQDSTMEVASVNTN